MLPDGAHGVEVAGLERVVERLVGSEDGSLVGTVVLGVDDANVARLCSAPMTTRVWVDTAAGTPVAAYDFGGHGEPLLFAHATGFHAHLWLPVIEHLRDRFHCFAFDERGHGASPTPALGDFDWRHMGDDARAVAAAFGLDRPGGVGHSAGAGLLTCAEQDHPRSWSSLWLYEPVIPDWPLPGPGDAEPENPMISLALRRRESFPSREDAYQNFAAKPPFNTFTPEALQLYVEHGFVNGPDGGVMLACSRADEAATYRGAAHHGAWDRLGEVGIAALVVCGASSDQMPGDLAPAVASRLPTGSLEPMAGLGHFGPFESPARVAASISAAFT